MNLSLYFKIANTLTLLPWLLMLMLPHWRFTKWVIGSYFFPMLLALGYSCFFVANLQQMTELFDSFNGFKKVFFRDELLFICWLHFLCIDLCIGSWMLRDAEKHHMKTALLFPSLLLTMFAGPLGWLFYNGLKKLS